MCVYTFSAWKWADALAHADAHMLVGSAVS